MNDKGRKGGYSPGRFREEATAFMKACMDAETFEKIMGKDAKNTHYFVAARVFLSDSDWKKFVWIEQNGSLTGFPE